MAGSVHLPPLGMKALTLLAAILAPSFVFGLVILAGGAAGPATQQSTLTALVSEAQCKGTGTLATLTPAQSSNAQIIVSVVAAASGESARAEQIALMVALTESDLHNDGPRSGNAGSLGLFQQRTTAGWGSDAEEMDPADATAMFIEHLLDLPGWQAMAPWLAAQAVQRSAFSSGSNYKKNWVPAGMILASITTTFTAGGCGGSPPGAVVGPATSYGLPASYTIPASATTAERLVLTYAISKLGSPYVWGAAGPTSFDCSGLTMMAWRQAGVSLEHYTVDQMHEGLAVSPAAIAPGDLVLIPGVDSPGPGLPGHVGIYLGDGLVESAVDPQVGTVVQSWTTFVSGGLDAVVNPAT
ncbi:MAG: C40 family peptidase [Actinomycetota bacterium]|jgi:cell wall-associated NlpC family hydrolase|nr:C40 family peptidase [Actinomycetota bacterium]